MHMAAVDLAPPAFAHFDFSIARGSAVADHEMIGQTVAHPANVAAVVVEDAGVGLSSAAVGHFDKTPALAQHRGMIDLVTHRASYVGVMLFEKVEGQKGKAARSLVAG